MICYSSLVGWQDDVYARTHTLYIPPYSRHLHILTTILCHTACFHEYIFISYFTPSSFSIHLTDILFWFCTEFSNANYFVKSGNPYSLALVSTYPCVQIRKVLYKFLAKGCFELLWWSDTMMIPKPFYSKIRYKYGQRELLLTYPAQISYTVHSVGI